MSKPRSNEVDAKDVLPVDAVVWSDAYPKGYPMRDVYSWYARWFKDMPAVRLTYAKAEDRLERARGASSLDVWREHSLKAVAG